AAGAAIGVHATAIDRRKTRSPKPVSVLHSQAIEMFLVAQAVPQQHLIGRDRHTGVTGTTRHSPAHRRWFRPRLDRLSNCLRVTVGAEDLWPISGCELAGPQDSSDQ